MSLLHRDQGLLQDSYYEATATRTPYPTLSENKEYDVCVIGGGFAGLSAAIELRKLGYSVCVLEAKAIGWGASGRNGGQVLVGYASDAEMLRQLSDTEAKRAWDISVEGVQLVKDRIQTYDIDCNWASGFLSVAVSAKKAKELFEGAKQLQEKVGYAYQALSPNELPQYINSPRYHSGLLDQISGHIHPLRYALGLAKAAVLEGASIYEHTVATHIDRAERPIVHTPNGNIRCQFVVLAANVYLEAFSPQLAPERSARMMPVGTYIIATEPLDPEHAKRLIPGNQAICDNNFVLDYFRFSADHRMIFGGRVSYSGLTPSNLQQKMQKRLAAVFPSLAQTPIAYTWGGYVDISMNRAPDFSRMGSNIYALQGFSGHGVALTGIAGKITALAIHGQSKDFDIFARLQHRPFPGGRLFRTPSLVIGMLYYQLKELIS